jgi:hypothetical protein
MYSRTAHWSASVCCLRKNGLSVTVFCRRIGLGPSAAGDARLPNDKAPRQRLKQVYQMAGRGEREVRTMCRCRNTRARFSSAFAGTRSSLPGYRSTVRRETRPSQCGERLRREQTRCDGQERGCSVCPASWEVLGREYRLTCTPDLRTRP